MIQNEIVNRKKDQECSSAIARWYPVRNLLPSSNDFMRHVVQGKRVLSKIRRAGRSTLQPSSLLSIKEKQFRFAVCAKE